jgi:Immunoglobulin domain
MVVREGSNVTLKCAARGSPQPNIIWRREGSEPIAITGQREGKQRKLMISFSAFSPRLNAISLSLTLSFSYFLSFYLKKNGANFADFY